MAAMVNQPTDEFGRGRSNDDSKAAYDLCKVIAQSCLLINGGAATAVVALLGKERVDQALLTYVPWGLTGYAVGVVISAYMLYCVMRMADFWNFHWYYVSYIEDHTKADAYKALANKWNQRMNQAFGFAIGCFAIASVIVAVGMSKVAPTPVQHQTVAPTSK